MKWNDVYMSPCYETYPCLHNVRLDSGKCVLRSGCWIIQELIAGGEYANTPKDIKSHFAEYQHAEAEPTSEDEDAPEVNKLD